jgi:hypothetical protein
VWTLVGVSAELVVEGTHGDRPFQGRVIAIALDDGPSGGKPSPEATWLLVSDDSAPSPIWVGQNEVATQRLGR